MAGPIMRIVDAHTHVFPQEVCLGRERFGGRDGWFGQLYENPRSTLATVEELIESMDASGIDRAVLCGFPWSDAGMCQYHNDYMRESVASYPDRLRWLAVVTPSRESRAGQMAIDAFEAGAAGIGELNADAQSFDLRNPRALDDVASACEVYRKPMLLHVSEPIGHQYPGKGTATPDRLLTFVEQHQDLQVIAAHWGGGLPFFELMPEVRQLAANVIYDSAASTYLYDFTIFLQALSLVGPQKIVFGTDYPLLKQHRFLKRVRALPWPDDSALNQILSGTAEAVFGFAERARQGD
jgi:uncharacterized protein